MPSDEHHGSHHRQVSSRVAYNRKRTRYAVEEHNARYDKNKEQKRQCVILDLRIRHCWYLVCIPLSLIQYGYLCQCKKIETNMKFIRQLNSKVKMRCERLYRRLKIFSIQYVISYYLQNTTVAI